MLVDWNVFNLMFPKYLDFKIPMWSDYKETEKEVQIKVVVPGYEKEDFKLYVTDGELFLDIINNNKPKGSLTYSISGNLGGSSFSIEDATANYKGGILTMKIPKTKKEQKKLEIKVS